VQFDLNAGEEQDIQTSRVLIASIWDNTYTEWFGDLQIAPNGKIYVARAHSKYMSVINNPNDIGNSCNFDHNILSLNNFIHLTKNRFGLPNFASNFLLPDDVAAETCPQLPVIDTFFIQIPNVFTPNGDNQNDYFTIQQQGVKEIRFVI